MNIVILTILWIYVIALLGTMVITFGGIFRIFDIHHGLIRILIIAMAIQMGGGAATIFTGKLNDFVNQSDADNNSGQLDCPTIPEQICPEMPECPALPEFVCPSSTDRTNPSRDYDISRTDKIPNTDEVVSSADRTKSSIGQIISAETIKELRQINGVSELNPLEIGRALTNLPNGRFGFERVRHINNYSSSEFDSTIFDSSVLDDSPNFTHRVMEVHKSSIGAIYIVGHLPPSVLVQVQKPNRKDPIDVILFFQPATNLVPVAIPVERIVQSYSRRAKDNEGNSIYVNDMIIR